jgi:hypothetical protein
MHAYGQTTLVANKRIPDKKGKEETKKEESVSACKQRKNIDRTESMRLNLLRVHGFVRLR